MEKNNQEKFVLDLIDRVDRKREEIRKLSSEIMEHELNLNPDNILKIKQKIQGIISSMASARAQSSKFSCPHKNNTQFSNYEFLYLPKVNSKG